MCSPYLGKTARSAYSPELLKNQCCLIFFLELVRNYGVLAPVSLSVKLPSPVSMSIKLPCHIGADNTCVLRGDQLEVVSHFKYLGSVFSSDCTLNAEITHRVAAANSAFQQLRRANIWSSRALDEQLRCWAM